MSCYNRYGLYSADDFDWENSTPEECERMAKLLVSQSTDLALLCSCAMENLSDGVSDLVTTHGEVVGGTDVLESVVNSTGAVLYKVWRDLCVVQDNS